jgi:hypothetical protein
VYIRKEDADAAIEASGKNEQVKKVFWTVFVAMAGLVQARVVGRVTAQQVVGLITGMGVWEEKAIPRFPLSHSLSKIQKPFVKIILPCFPVVWGPVWLTMEDRSGFFGQSQKDTGFQPIRNKMQFFSELATSLTANQLYKSLKNDDKRWRLIVKIGGFIG